MGAKKEDEVLRNFYHEVYKCIVKDGELLAELYRHGLDCSVFNKIRTTPVMPKRRLKFSCENSLGVNETMILESLKRDDPERYAYISQKMSLVIGGFESLWKSILLNDREKKKLLKIFVRIHKTYIDDLWKWYLNKYNAAFGVAKDLKTDKQPVEWLAWKLFNYIKPFKEKADNAWNRPGQKAIPNASIYEMIADIMNHGKEQHEKLTVEKVKWYIENYEKIKT